MKIGFLFFLLLFATTGSFGQIIFEEGYFIDNNNQRTECLIKNVDWRENPREFEYKQNEYDDPTKGNLATIKEFGILGYSRFIRADVRIDRTSNENINKFTSDKNPSWSEEQLFLKVLVEGEASLYSYTEGNLERFFYSTADSLPQQLIYKKYLAKSGAVATNHMFRQQLWTDVKCGNTAIASMGNINYYRKSLEKYFIRYNECIEASYKVYNTKEKRDLFNVRVTPGITYSSISVDHVHLGFFDVDFNHQVTYRIGAEAEFILPFNKNKWGIIIEPTYQYFHSEKELPRRMASIDYNSIEFPIGIRHYFFITDNSRAFLNGHFISNKAINFNSSVNFGNTSLDISNGINWAVGGGVAIRRISAEVRYYSNRKILNFLSVYDTDYSRVSFIMGFKLF